LVVVTSASTSLHFVPDGFFFPEDFPDDMFEPTAYPDDPKLQQHVMMRGKNGELVFFNGNPKLNIWTAFVQMDGGTFKYFAPFQHENYGGGATILPFRLKRNAFGVVVGIKVVLWARPRKNIRGKGGKIDMSWVEVKGGFREKFETAIETAKRELREESGGLEAGEAFETSVARAAINRATTVLLSKREGVVNTAYEMTDKQYEEFRGNPDDRIMSIWDVANSRDSLAKAAAFDLLAWVKRNYTTAL
jgi:hypothetical protein